MEKLKFILLIAVAAGVMANLGLGLFQKSELSKAKDDILAAQKNIRSAICVLDSAQNRISGLMNNIDSTRVQLNSVNNSVAQLNGNMTSSILKVSDRIKNLDANLKAEEARVKALQTELQKLQ